MSTRYAYIACPYTHGDPRKREERYEAATTISAILARLGLRLYSPLTHTHPLDTCLRERQTEMGQPEWLQFDKPFAVNADVLIVLMVPGWQESDGVKRETNFFLKMKRPILYIDTDDFHLMEEKDAEST